MARSVQSVLDEARGHLQDTVAPYRYADSYLVQFVNDAIQEVRTERPDMFFGAFTAAVPVFSIAQLASDYPFDRYAAATAEYVAALAELRDDEFAVGGRAIVLRELFMQKITGKVPRP